MPRPTKYFKSSITHETGTSPGGRLRIARTRKGISAEGLSKMIAEKSGQRIPVATLHAWEAGTRQLSQDIHRVHVRLLAAALDVSEEYIWAGRDVSWIEEPTLPDVGVVPCAATDLVVLQSAPPSAIIVTSEERAGLDFLVTIGNDIKESGLLSGDAIGVRVTEVPSAGKLHLVESDGAVTVRGVGIHGDRASSGPFTGDGAPCRVLGIAVLLHRHVARGGHWRLFVPDGLDSNNAN